FHLNPTQEEIAISAGLMGAIIGALCSGPMNDALGRKRALILLAVIFIVGSLLTAVAPTYGFFLACRIIVGFAFGAAGSVVPVYISEFAPANKRGTLVSFIPGAHILLSPVPLCIASGCIADALSVIISVGLFRERRN